MEPNEIIEASPTRKCRVCGCTDEDCSQCIEKTGSPCHWVEDDLCSACVETSEIKVTDTRAVANQNSNSSNNNDMNFFEQLGAHLGDVDMTIRFFKKNGRFTLNVMPGNKSNMKPLIISGTPEELDNGFFETIAPGIKEISGMITNMDEVKKDVAEKAEKKKAATETKTKTDKKKPEKKKQAKAKTKKAVPAEAEESAPVPSLFEANRLINKK